MCGFFFVYYYYHDNISLNKIQILYVWYGLYAKVDNVFGQLNGYKGEYWLGLIRTVTRGEYWRGLIRTVTRGDH